MCFNVAVETLVLAPINLLDIDFAAYQPPDIGLMKKPNHLILLCAYVVHVVERTVPLCGQKIQCNPSQDAQREENVALFLRTLTIASK